MEDHGISVSREQKSRTQTVESPLRVGQGMVVDPKALAQGSLVALTRCIVPAV